MTHLLGPTGRPIRTPKVGVHVRSGAVLNVSAMVSSDGGPDAAGISMACLDAEVYVEGQAPRTIVANGVRPVLAVLFVPEPEIDGLVEGLLQAKDALAKARNQVVMDVLPEEES